MTFADRARDLVTDWQANGNSRELGDPTAGVWHKAARQLLDVLNAIEQEPTEAEVQGLLSFLNLIDPGRWNYEMARAALLAAAKVRRS